PPPPPPPPRASRPAAARPMPLAAPVTSATLPPKPCVPLPRFPLSVKVLRGSDDGAPLRHELRLADAAAGHPARGRARPPARADAVVPRPAPSRHGPLRQRAARRLPDR